MTNGGKLFRTLIFASLTSILFAPTLASADYRPATYKVTIYNLTAGQPFTPPVIALHNRRANVFAVGDEANIGVVSIAENGNLEPLVTALAGDVNVFSYVQGNAPIVPANNPGGTGFTSSVTFEISTDRRARFLSFVSMLICTNDGFTGLNTVRLPNRKATFYAAAYETRTEQNTEDFADIVPPCQGLIGASSDDAGVGESNPLLAEDGVIIPHAGIIGDNDLDRRIHDWADPVAKIVVERVRRY
ncbi:MAG: spondin domain-containing protein [Woeseiaceae bacterium]|nr:spondin domain-containing protein [Woeseiaceae bacterium]